MVLLLHAVATTASLSWFTTVDALLADYRVVLMDQRWHGRGLPSDRFSLSECADDIDALLTTLDIDQAIVVGYSMGGALAQVLARQHPERISGLVLCSTATTWKGNAGEAMFYPVLSAFTAMGRRHTSSKVRQHADSLPHRCPTSRTTWRCGRGRSSDRPASGRCPRCWGSWVASTPAGTSAAVKVPTAVVVTCKDKVIAPARQHEMAAMIPGAKVFEAPGGHASVVLDSERWRPVFLQALAHVSGVEAAA